MTVRQARLPLALAIEVLAAFALAAVVVRMVSNGDGPGPSLITVAVVVLGSFALARLLGALPETQARAVTLAASVILLALIAYAEYAATRGDWSLAALAHSYAVAGIVVLALIWLRGIAAWSAEANVRDALTAAAIAVGAVALAAIVDPPARGWHAFGIIAVAVFVLAWLLLALAQTADGEEPLARFAARWSTGLGAVLGIAVLLTIAIAAFDPHTLGALSPALDALGHGVAYALGIILRPFVALFSFLGGLLHVHRPHIKHDVTPSTPPPLQPKHGGTSMWLYVIVYTLSGLAGAAIVIGFFTALWFAVRRRKSNGDAGERRTAVERDGGIMDDLRALFDGIAHRGRRPGSMSSVAIRRLYADMLARAADDGLERPTAATPSRFAPELEQRYGSSVPSEITQSFVASRYGGTDIDVEAVRRLRATWQQALDAKDR